MAPPHAVMLPDGRLHLQHGPIDIVADAIGPGRAQAYRAAAALFSTLLQDLAADLEVLRSRSDTKHDLPHPVARAMQDATRPFAPEFVTPMAAVAGAVADAVCAAMAGAPGVTKAHANNGGDVAFHLTAGTTATAAIAAPTPARVTIPYDSAVRGVATSGWRGRSHSLGIADSVTVLARSAAQADAAATLIANAVDLPGDTRIGRRPARDLAPDSDLGERLVTTAVPPLGASDIAAALEAGRHRAQHYRERGLIVAALLVLQGQIVTVGDLPRGSAPLLS